MGTQARSLADEMVDLALAQIIGSNWETWMQPKGSCTYSEYLWMRSFVVRVPDNVEQHDVPKTWHGEQAVQCRSFLGSTSLCPCFGVLIIGAALTVLGMLPCALSAGSMPLDVKSGANQGPDRVPASGPKVELTGREIAALKKEELDLAENLVKAYPNQGQPLIVLANVWHRHGHAVEALKYWQQALKKTPDRADVYETMAWVSIKKGKFKEAIVSYLKALAIQPKRPDIYSNIGHALMILGQHNEAKAALHQEIKISPQSVFSYFLLGQIHLQQKEYEKAREYYQMAVKINPKYTNAYFGLATASARLDHQTEARNYSDRFKLLKAEDRKGLKSRKNLYDDLTETHKRAALTYGEVARVYMADGKFQQSQKLLERAIDLDMENSACLMELAALYQQNKDLPRALATYQKAVRVEPRNAMGHFKIGLLCARLKQMDKAEAAMHQVIRLNPDQAAAYRELALIYTTKRTSLSYAKTLAEKAVALQESAYNYYVLSLVCSRNGDPGGTKAAIQQALRLEPGNARYRRLYEQFQLRN